MGKYQVSECIGRGGMAEVFLARQDGIGGFEKLVAVKRIYPHLIHDESFIEMFLTEARIAASLQHPKIVQILDIDNDADGFFIVMEYLAGESIFQILSLLSERGEKIPPRIVCRIGSDVATGLQAAHMASDSHGESRPVVHRDVTPSNVLISFIGEVKVLDFGVAKAAKRQVTTDKGVLKGKTPYLTPEQINGESVDPRADVFQLGIVLHEMLTGKQLFDGDTFPAIMKAITESEIVPPSSVNSNCPEALDAIVLKALERDPANRYQTAEDVAHALDTVSRTLGEPVSERTLGKWMSETFPEREKEKRRLKKAALGHGDSSGDGRLPSSLPPDADGLSTQLATVYERPMHATDRHGARKYALWLGLGCLAALAVLVLGGDDEPHAARERAPAASVPVAASVATSVNAPTVMADAATVGYRVRVITIPKEASIEIAGSLVATGEYDAVVEESSVIMKISAGGYETQEVTVSRADPMPDVVQLRALPPASTDKKPFKREEKTTQPRDQAPAGRTKPFGSDNLNPWESS